MSLEWDGVGRRAAVTALFAQQRGVSQTPPAAPLLTPFETTTPIHPPPPTPPPTCNTGCMVRTTKGNDTNTMASATPRRLNTTLMPSLLSSAPMMPSSLYTVARVRPATEVGSAKVRSTAASLHFSTDKWGRNGRERSSLSCALQNARARASASRSAAGKDLPPPPPPKKVHALSAGPSPRNSNLSSTHAAMGPNSRPLAYPLFCSTLVQG